MCLPEVWTENRKSFFFFRLFSGFSPRPKSDSFFFVFPVQLQQKKRRKNRPVVSTSVCLYSVNKKTAGTDRLFGWKTTNRKSHLSFSVHCPGAYVCTCGPIRKRVIKTHIIKCITAMLCMLFYVPKQVLHSYMQLKLNLNPSVFAPTQIWLFFRVSLSPPKFDSISKCFLSPP